MLNRCKYITEAQERRGREGKCLCGELGEKHGRKINQRRSLESQCIQPAQGMALHSVVTADACRLAEKGILHPVPHLFLPVGAIQPLDCGNY